MSECVYTRTEQRVTFYSPGTLFSESSQRDIDSWDAPTACRMAKEVVERHGARPYGFRFSTVVVADPVPDHQGSVLEVLPREVETSGIYHLGGTIRTYEEVVADNKPGEEILRSNMRCNGIGAVVVNTNSYQSIHPFEDRDVLLDPETGEERAFGNERRFVEARERLREKAAA